MKGQQGVERGISSTTAVLMSVMVLLVMITGAIVGALALIFQ